MDSHSELILMIALPFSSCGFHIPPRYELPAAPRAKRMENTVWGIFMGQAGKR